MRGEIVLEQQPDSVRFARIEDREDEARRMDAVIQKAAQRASVRSFRSLLARSSLAGGTERVGSELGIKVPIEFVRTLAIEEYSCIRQREDNDKKATWID